MTHRLVENPPLPGKGDDGLDQSLRIRVTNDFDPNDAAFETGISVRAFSDGVVQAARVAMTKGRGTSSNPQPVEELDFIGEVRFSGYYGDTHDDVATGALIQGQASEDWTPTNRGMDIVFWTIEPGTAILDERIRISSDGLLLTGDFTVTGGLTFSTLALNGAISIAGTLEVTGDLTIGGDFLFDNDLDVTGELTAGGGLVITGDGTFNDSLVVHGPGPWIDVTHPTFGAIPSSSIDNTAAIQAAIDFARTNPGGLAGASAVVYFPPGIYCFSHLDCTGVDGLELRGHASWGVALYANKQTVSSKVALDFTGSNSCVLRGFTVHGENTDGSFPAVLPTVGILFAETLAGGDSNKNRMEDVGCLGKFTVAPLYLYGTTDNNFGGCALQQKTDGQPVLFIGSANSFSVASLFQTIGVGTLTTGEHSFFQCEFHDLVGGVSTVPTVRLQGVYNIRFYGGNNSNSGPAHVYVLGTCRNLIFNGVQFYSDDGNPSDAVIKTNGTGLDGITLDQCDYQAGIGAIFTATPTGSSIEGVNVHGKITSNGFAGKIADMAAGSDIKNGVLACDGLDVDVSVTGTLDHLLLINPGTITAGTDNSTPI